MKPSKWTKEILKELSKDFSSPGLFKKSHPSAYKSLRKQGFIDEMFPTRQRHKPYTEDELKKLALNCTKRSDFQLKYPSAYNAAKAMNLIPTLFPVSHRYDLFGRQPYTKEELTIKSKTYKTKKEFSQKENGAYQVACRKDLLNDMPNTHGTSEAELDLLSWLKDSVSSDFKTKRFNNDYELDCYSEKLKLGVEYNGFYWHSEANKPRLYHLLKTKYFENIGIRIIHVWEDEWKDRKEQVKNYLLSACNANSIRLGARKCEFKEIDRQIARDFLNSTHIQGAPINIQLAIGCYHGEKLIGVSTFGPHHRQNENKVSVLNRFACLRGYTICGGLAKMSKMAFIKLGPLLSWADYSKSQAKGYLAAGWQVKEVLRVDYFYADHSGNRIGKQSRRKSLVNTPKDMTESQHAKLDGLYRIWDCGKIALYFC